MRLIFIRHGEPNYENDSLTENGLKEANALSKRVAKWNIDRIYVSPMGRAKLTAAPSLAVLNMEAIELPWLREYSYQITNPTHGETSVCWDFVPSDWTNKPEMYTPTDWLNIDPASQNHELKTVYQTATKGLDLILEEYGYIRSGMYYKNIKNPKMRRITRTNIDFTTPYVSTLPESDAEPNIVFFCHYGITCLMLSYLTGINFIPLVQGAVIPPSGVTVISTEERWDDEASFRIQMLGDVSHLRAEGLPISGAGSFTPPFQL